MNKILLTSTICASIMFAASNPSKDYNYDLSLFAAGILSDSKANLTDDKYVNGGIALGKNLSNSFINQVELSYLRSNALSYKNGASTYINRFFLNLIKDFPLTEKLTAFGLVGAGYQDITGEVKGENEDSPTLNYGLGLKYDIPYYGMAIKTGVRHLYATKNKLNDFMYTLGLAMPLGNKDVDIAAAVPVIAEPVMVEEKVIDGDDDNDGVLNSKDLCPNTIPGAIVDENGCELDDDNDGVVNRLDKCPNTSEGVKVNKDGCVDTIDLKINFAYNSAKIQSKYNEQLENFASLMNENTKLTATIEAHTDGIGSQRYNLKLSEKRAASAVNAITSYGVSSSRLGSVGYGKSQPIASNDTEEGRAANRRVIGYLNQ